MRKTRSWTKQILSYHYYHPSSIKSFAADKTQSRSTKGSVTLVNLQRQLATPIRNACFSHEFADMLHFWIAFKNFQRVAALQISRKIVRNRPLTKMIFRATSYHCKLALQVDQCNTTLSLVAYNATRSKGKMISYDWTWLSGSPLHLRDCPWMGASFLVSLSDFEYQADRLMTSRADDYLRHKGFLMEHSSYGFQKTQAIHEQNFWSTVRVMLRRQRGMYKVEML